MGSARRREKGNLQRSLPANPAGGIAAVTCNGGSHEVDLIRFFHPPTLG
jgi:hypothetical protein